MQPKSRACIFLGYSFTQNAYKCFDPHLQKFFISRHVLFDKTQYHYPSSQILSKPVSPASHQVTPLHFGSPQIAVPPPMVSTTPISSLSPKDSPAIVASSPGNFNTPASSLNLEQHPSFTLLNWTIVQLLLFHLPLFPVRSHPPILLLAPAP